MSVAFALAAVLSPTDPIAVSAIVQRVPMARRMVHTLEGESLLHDASGLVCFRFAVAAMLTGAVSLSGVLLDIVWIAAGGITVGVALTRASSWLKSLVSQHLGEGSGSQILISLLIPFGCYLLAEKRRCSGILAAVSVGLTMSFVKSSGHALDVTRTRRNTVWDVIHFTANGVIFVLLGEQLHGIASSAAATVRLTRHDQPAWLIAYVLAITLVRTALRFAWVLVSLRLRELRGRPPVRHWRRVGVISLASVRGASPWPTC